MAFSAPVYGAISVPLSHLVAMSAGYLFIWGYRKHCGKLNYKPIVFGFTAGILIMILSWFTIRKGNFFVPAILWASLLFVLFFAPIFRGKQIVMKIFYSLRRGTL
jgi:hypothetical protein